MLINSHSHFDGIRIRVGTSTLNGSSTCYKSDLLAFLCAVFSCAGTIFFSYCALGQVWYLIVSLPDLCLFFSII